VVETFLYSKATPFLIDNKIIVSFDNINSFDLFLENKNNKILTLKGTDFFNKLLLRKIIAYV
jgi:hypothetical protein